MANILQNISNLSPGRLVSISAIIIFLLSFFVYIGLKLSATDYAVLYTNLELEDAKQIVTVLETNNVRFRLNKNGTEVLVPQDQISRMRIDTAEIALGSKGANVGYEIFDQTDALGSTNFVQNVNLIRALEGELSRTIRNMDNIRTARVHLVLPKREMFSREEQAPSASVVIRTTRGKLPPQTIQAIQKVIAAAVPKLEVKNVAIVDSAGALLTNNFESSEELANINNENIRQDQERQLSMRVQNLLERTIGDGKVRAQVNLEMDFDHIVTNEEIFDPNGQVVRSQATVTEEGSNNQQEGPVTVSNNIPNADSYQSASGGVSSNNSRTEETVNYEISKVVRNKVKNIGSVSRLTVAVMVDGIYGKDEAGQAIYRDRTDDELDQIASLVKMAVGYDANRGDLIEVRNMRFIPVDMEEAGESEAFILGFSKEEIIRIAEGLGVAIVAILVIFLVIRPLLNNAFDASKNGEGRLVGEGGVEGGEDNLLLSNFLNEEEGDVEELINLNKVDGRIKASSLRKINEIVNRSPETAVNIIRQWLYQGE